MKILLNYADGKYFEAQQKNCLSGMFSGFNVVYKMSRNEIDASFLSRNEEILNQKRGAGYWLWKPYFINRILTELSESDVLFYSDSGSVFIRGARAGVNVDGCRRFESGVKKRYESCFRPLHLFLVTEKKKKICVEGVKKNRPQTEKTAAFKAAGSDQFHIGPCTGGWSPCLKGCWTTRTGCFVLSLQEITRNAFGPNEMCFCTSI